MTDQPVDLDSHRAKGEKTATELRRRRLHEIEISKTRLQERHSDLETMLSMAPALNWQEAAAKSKYLIQLLAMTTEAIDPRLRRLIEQTVDDLTRLSANEKNTPNRSDN